MSRILVQANVSTAARRYAYFHLVDVSDGISAETGEAGGQPQISTNGAAFTNTGIGVLSHLGNGRYYAELTQAAVQTAGDLIETRYKSANTAECPGDSIQVVGFDPADTVRLGLTAMPNVASGSAGAIITSGTGTAQLSVSGGVAQADSAAISGDTTAADRLETMLDGTGGQTLSLGRLVVASSSNDVAVSITGSGTGAGMAVAGGATGAGVTIAGGGTSGNGITLTTTSGDGLSLSAIGTAKHAFKLATSDGSAIYAAATGAYAGAQFIGGATGDGLTATGGSTSGDGARFVAATSGDGLDLVAAGAGVGLKATGGATGHGGTFTGGATSGDGLRCIAATLGDGIEIAGAGTAMLDFRGKLPMVMRINTAQTGAAGTITLDASASSVNDYYNDSLVAILTGTGADQVRRISDYVGSTKVASVSPNWNTNPDSTSVFAVLAAGQASVTSTEILTSGTAQAGASGTITLAAGASATSSLFVGLPIRITGGTGSGQARVITAYNGSTKVATVDWSWTTTPDNTSTYEIVGQPTPKLNSSVGVVLASTGLDAIATTAPSGVASTFREMVVQVWRRFFKKAYKSSTQLLTYADDGTTVVTTQTISETSTTQTQGTAT